MLTHPATQNIELWPIERLREYPRNPRKNDKAVDRMCESIREFGFKIPCLVRGDGEIVDGHLRLKAARKLAIEEVPVILCDEWTPAQVKAFRLMVNRSVTWADWDEELLALELQEIQESDFDLSLTGFDPGEIDGLLALEDDEKANAAPPLPETPVSQLGDLWLLGPHRILCGDATSAEAVTRLLGGRKPRLMVTDPPYGIELDSEWRDRAGLNGCGAAEPSYMKKRTKGHTETTISGDTRADWSEAFALVPSLDVAYVWHASKFTREVLDGLLRIGFEHHQQIIWDKGRTVLTRTLYWFQHEPCWFVRKKNAPWFGKAGENSTIWSSPSPKFIMGGADEEKYDHPAQKPIELMRRPILNHLRRGELVYDPFLGSGTTLATIQRAGTIANFGGGFVNNGLVLANGVNPVVLDIGAATARGNAGVTSAGTIEIANGSTLQILSPSGGTVLTTGTGEIFLASAPTGVSTLSFNDQGKGGTFTLDSGTVVMSIGGNRIVGVNGDETLINGMNSTIVGQGVISNFAQFINNRALQTGGGVIEVKAPLSNRNGGTGTLTGGTYIADAGILKLDSLGAQTVTNLTGADISIQGAGAITGSGNVNVLGELANMTNSSILLDSGSALAITPGGGALTLTNSDLIARGASLAVDGSVSINAQSTLESLSGASVAITGSLFADGTSKIDVRNATTLAASDFLNEGTITLNAASTAAFKGRVTNSGVVIVTAGAQFDVLRSPFLAFGTNTYTQTVGNTKVFAGWVLSAATVDLDGGTLGGGTIAASVIVNGGTLAPGDPTTTSIAGDLTVDAGEIVLDIDGTASGTFDSLDVDGNLHLDGGTLDIVFEGGFLPQLGDEWNLFSVTGLEDGPGFAHIVFQNAGNVQLESFFNDGSFKLEAAGGETVSEPSALPVLLALLALVGLHGLGKRLRRLAARSLI